MRKGLPDITGLIQGQHVEIEVKLPGNTPTPLQKKKLERYKECGAIVGWTTSVDGAVDIIRKSGRIDMTSYDDAKNKKLKKKGASSNAR